MEEKSNNSQSRQDTASESQLEGSSQKITNFFPVLRTEGRAKMCALKTDDSKQKEMLKKIKSKESMTLRSKKQEKVSEKTSKNDAASSSQSKEKIRSISVASALKTPLSQVLRRSIEASDKKEFLEKSNQSKLSESSNKTANFESSYKKNVSENEGGRTLRQKNSLPDKKLRSVRRKSDSSQIQGAGTEKVRSETRGRPPYKNVAHSLDSAAEEIKSDNANSNSNSANKARKYRKRHFRGGTYGLYLTPARKRKKKMKSTDESKDDEGSVTSTENNSFLDSEDGNSLVSEDFFTPSEKSLVDEEHGLESRSSSILMNSEQICEKVESKSSESEELNSGEQMTKTEESETKIEITADYEENTQNVTDLFQDLEEMQWETDQKTDDKTADNSTSQTIKAPQYDDISSSSFSNSLHFSFKKNSIKDSEESEMKGLIVTEKSEESVVHANNTDDVSNVSTKLENTIDLPITSETSLSIQDNISEMFDMKDDSNIASSDISETKDDINLITSDMSQIKEDLNLESSDMLTNKENLNLVFSVLSENKDINLISSEIPNKDLNIATSDLFEEKGDSTIHDIKSEKDQEAQLNVQESEEIADSQMSIGINNDDSDSYSLIDTDKQNSDVFLEEKKPDPGFVIFVEGDKNDSDSLTFMNENKHENISDSLSFMEDNKNNINNIIVFVEEEKNDSNSLAFVNENKQDSNSPTFMEEENKQNSDSPRFINEDKENSESVMPMTENIQNVEPLGYLNENKPDSISATSVTEKDMKTIELNLENKENENQFECNMEIDNTEKEEQDDENDAQSTIATCVKSRQRIKRRFTDDIVDTDLGILSVAAMANVKKAASKQDVSKDVIENFQSITHGEARKSGSMTKIECVFNYKQSPVKSCTCEGDTYQAKLTKDDDGAFCQAVDSIDDKLVGCSNPIVTSRLVRPSVKIPFTIMCEMHLWRLRHHHCCPYCGLFCSQGPFIQCSNKENRKLIHLFHEQCQTRDDGQPPFCLHCGSSSTLKRVNLEMHMASPPSFFLSQSSKVSVPDVSKARISFSESTDFCKRDEEEPSHVYNVDDSGKVLSTAGLPDGAEKEELEKLIINITEDRVRSYSFGIDDFYDMAATGNITKVLYMIAKGVDPNQKFPQHDNETALHASAAGGHITVVHLLIQAGGVNDFLNEKMYTPLMLAVENGHKDIVHYLVKKGAITDFKGENGMSSLHLAAKSGNLDILKILMSSRNIDIDALDDGGWTPIVWASEHDHFGVVKYLLKRGANPNIRDNEGNIGLHWSAFSGSVDISYLYLDFGCDINAVNELGDTPIHIAARQDSFPCVTLFLSRGADVQIVNKAGKLPAECCIDKNSDTYLSLSLNMLLKRITGKYQHKAEKILHRDISRGKEQIAIQCVNAIDDEMPPLDFLYVTENCETMPIKIDRTITSLQSCHCEDDCSSSNCNCSSISYQCWYDKEGLLLPEFNLLDPPMLFECNRACSCWSLNCHNRVLQNGITSRLQLIRTKGKGWGVRTLKDIPKGAFICEYVGELISDSAADKRADDSYLFDLDNRDGETYCLDARYYGNISRFINHLCEPNLVPVKVYVDHQDLNFPRIAFFSSRDIKQYEELGFDYGEKFWAIKYKFFTCECGTLKCKYSKESIHTTLANYYRRLKEEQMEEASQQPAAQPE